MECLERGLEYPPVRKLPHYLNPHESAVYTFIRKLTVYSASHVERQAMLGESSGRLGYGSIDEAAGGGFNPRASGMHFLP